MANMASKTYTIEQYLDSLKTPAGGYTRETLQMLGVSWPPQKGWRKQIITEYNQQLAHKVSGPDYNTAV